MITCECGAQQIKKNQWNCECMARSIARHRMIMMIIMIMMMIMASSVVFFLLILYLRWKFPISLWLWSAQKHSIRVYVCSLSRSLLWFHRWWWLTTWWPYDDAINSMISIRSHPKIVCSIPFHLYPSSNTRNSIFHYSSSHNLPLFSISIWNCDKINYLMHIYISILSIETSGSDASKQTNKQINANPNLN